MPFSKTERIFANNNCQVLYFYQTIQHISSHDSNLIPPALIIFLGTRLTPCRSNCIFISRLTELERTIHT